MRQYPNIDITEDPARPYDSIVTVFSDFNGDHIVFAVSACRDEDAADALQNAFEDWHTCDPYETLFDTLRDALTSKGIPFEELDCYICDAF